MKQRGSLPETDWEALQSEVHVSEEGCRPASVIVPCPHVFSANMWQYLVGSRQGGIASQSGEFRGADCIWRCMGTRLAGALGGDDLLGYIWPLKDEEGTEPFPATACCLSAGKIPPSCSQINGAGWSGCGLSLQARRLVSSPAPARTCCTSLSLCLSILPPGNEEGTSQLGAVHMRGLKA